MIANNGNRDTAERDYFAKPYRSFHGSANRRDSESALIVAHPNKSAAEIAETVDRGLRKRRWQHAIRDVLVELRYGDR